MILADTSVWIDYFRNGDAGLSRLLLQKNIVIHPFIVAELALGNLPQRQQTLADLERLPTVQAARPTEIRHIIEFHRLFRRGIGFVDVHLIAATLITPDTALWSRDKHLRAVAESLGIHGRIA